MQKPVRSRNSQTISMGEQFCGPQAVALSVANNKQRDTQSPKAAESQENRLVITEMEQFILGLQLSKEVIPNPFGQESKDDAGGWIEVKDSNGGEVHVNEEKEDITPDEVLHEVLVGKGIANALKLLRDRGGLNESVGDNDGPKEINIERRDEYGRTMTPKEAFRRMSHTFHGKGPGKMKQEKRLKLYQQDLGMKQMTPSQSIERMREAQARLQTPYLVLSGHVKPRVIVRKYPDEITADFLSM